MTIYNVLSLFQEEMWSQQSNLGKKRGINITNFYLIVIRVKSITQWFPSTISNITDIGMQSKKAKLTSFYPWCRQMLLCHSIDLAHTTVLLPPIAADKKYFKTLISLLLFIALIWKSTNLFLNKIHFNWGCLFYCVKLRKSLFPNNFHQHLPIYTLSLILLF